MSYGGSYSPLSWEVALPLRGSLGSAIYAHDLIHGSLAIKPHFYPGGSGESTGERAGFSPAASGYVVRIHAARRKCSALPLTSAVLAVQQPEKALESAPLPVGASRIYGLRPAERYSPSRCASLTSAFSRHLSAAPILCVKAQESGGTLVKARYG